ncbi:MAG TPA: 50S ribosomal protein L11 methyltransferase [Opitutaceae bacterium]
MTKAKALLKSILPASTYAGLVRGYRGWLATRSYQRAGLVANKLVARYGAEVREGPFKGMKLRLDAIGSAVSPKLVGSYEAEVHAAVETIVAGGYSRVLNIGCAEGFYAVGLALRMPQAEIWAFDIDPAAHAASAALAALNGVPQRLHIAGECTHARLDELCTEDTVIVCDIEGAEKELLDPTRAAGLRKADILVEIHPTETGESLEDLLESRFAATHTCEMIPTAPRVGSDYPWLREGLTGAEVELALCEFRPIMHWGFFRRRR